MLCVHLSILHVINNVCSQVRPRTRMIGRVELPFPKVFLGLPVLHSYVSTNVPRDFHALFSPPVILGHPGLTTQVDL